MQEAQKKIALIDKMSAKEINSDQELAKSTSPSFSDLGSDQINTSIN